MWRFLLLMALNNGVSEAETILKRPGYGLFFELDALSLTLSFIRPSELTWVPFSNRYLAMSSFPERTVILNTKHGAMILKS